MKGRKSTNILIFLSAGVFLFGIGFKLGQYIGPNSNVNSSLYRLVNTSNPTNAQNTKNVDFSLFWDVWNTLQNKFVDRSKLNGQNMFYGALKGMTNSLGDPYTFFLTPKENQQSKEDLGGKFQGIGAQLGLKNNQIIIIAPLKNSPAQKAGVKAGDIILKVDSQSTQGWTLPQAVAKIRGEKGTKVKLTLNRNGKSFDVTITREEIIVASIEFSNEKKLACKSNCPQVAYIKINQFGENTNDEWDKAVEQISSEWSEGKIKGLVIDLRDNPGGFLESSVYLAEDFLPYGKLVVKQESTTGENKDYNVSRQGKLLNIPVEILINKGSASASEIFAGALHDYKRAQLVGEKSFGKGSVQEAVDLKDGSGLHVTVAKWILPDGVWINGKGVQPDISINNKIAGGNTLTRENDQQLEKAVDQLLK